VPEYWIVDVDTRAVERWRANELRAELLAERIEWHPEGAEEPLVIDLAEYFADVFAEKRR
jgi:Uma2 family endonuclease